MDRTPLKVISFFILAIICAFIISSFYSFFPKRQEAQARNETIPYTQNEIGNVEVPKTPNVLYKKFLVIKFNHIGFTSGGVNLGTKYYPDGTVFEILRETNDTITINQEGIDATYPKAPFSGAYGTSGTIATVKWDSSNNRPTGLDLEGEGLTRYYHFILLLIYKYFWAVAIFLGLTCGVGFLMEDGKRAKQWTALAAAFLVIGACQGNEYKNYLNKFDHINNTERSLHTNTFGVTNSSGFNIETSTSYNFGNVVYIPLFLAFHVGLAYVLFLTFVFLYYLFVPHPIEKVLLAVKSGKMERQEAFSEIDAALYDLERDGVPVKWKSDVWRKRIEALTKRVKAEDDFMKELIQYIKTKSRFE